METRKRWPRGCGGEKKEWLCAEPTTAANRTASMSSSALARGGGGVDLAHGGGGDRGRGRGAVATTASAAGPPPPGGVSAAGTPLERDGGEGAGRTTSDEALELELGGLAPCSFRTTVGGHGILIEDASARRHTK